MASAGTLFTLCVWLYGIPFTVSLGLLASSAYCGVTYVSFTLEGRTWRRALETSYDRLFAVVYGASPPTNKTPTLGDAADTTREERDDRRRGQASLQCHREAQKMINLIMRDFVLEWYRSVTTETEFPHDCQKVLEHVALEINIRLQQIDLDQVILEVLTTLLPCLEAVNQAGKMEYNGVEIFDVRHERCLRAFEENPGVAHRALRSPEAETRYHRQLLDAVVQCALPEEYRCCDLTCMFLREILLGNILEPVLTLVCDPDFLNKVYAPLSQTPLGQIKVCPE